MLPLRTDGLGGRVECHSGHTYAQEPRAFAWQGQRQVVAQVLDRWRLPAGPAFRVRTVAGQIFDLHYDEAEDLWHIRPYEAGGPNVAEATDLQEV